MNIFKWLFRTIQNRANVMVNNTKDPISQIEEKLLEMRDDLSKNLEYLAKVKAQAILVKNEKETYIANAKAYENKAIDVLKEVQINAISSDEADRLAKEALMKKEILLEKIEAATLDYDTLDYEVKLLKANTENIKSRISDWDAKLETLKTELKINKASQNINKQLRLLNVISTTSDLELLEEQVSKHKLQIKSSEHIDGSTIDLDDEIDFTLETYASKVDDKLNKLKENLDNEKNI